MNAQYGTSTNKVTFNANAVGGVHFFSTTATSVAAIHIAGGKSLTRDAASTLPVVWIEDQARATLANFGTVRATNAQNALSFSRAFPGLSKVTIDNNIGATIAAAAGGYAFATSAGIELTLNNKAGARLLGAGSTAAGSTAVLNNAGVWAPNRDSSFNGAVVLNNSGVFDNYLHDTKLSEISNTGLVIIGAGGSVGAGGAYQQNSGAIIVDGTLRMRATIASGQVIGSGTIAGHLAMQGGTLSPGMLEGAGTMTVNGSLVIGSGATYQVDVEGAAADRVNVAGSASLGGKLQLIPLGGPYTFNTPYTLLSANSVAGTFGTVETVGSFGAAVESKISYSRDKVELTLKPTSLTDAITAAGTGDQPYVNQPAPSNVTSISRAIDLAIRNGGNASALFSAFAQRTPAQIIQALGQLTGETHAGAPAAAAQTASGFMQTTLDPNLAGRSNGPVDTSASGPEIGFAAYASSTGSGDLPTRKGPSFSAYPEPARNYGVWAAATGSKTRIDGDRLTGTRSNSGSSGLLAVGIDLKLLPDTIVGVAVGAGEVRSTQSDGLSSTRADILQAALYGMTRFGAFSFGATLGYASLDTFTTRSIPVLGQSVTGEYRAEVWGGRIEAGYDALRMAGWTVTPFMAGQFQSVRQPGFTERDAVTQLAAGVTVSGRDSLTSRGEFGAKVQAEFALGGLRSTAFLRAAWAHYFKQDNVMSASLTALPGAAFAVRGAQPDRNAALVSTGLDIKLSPAMTAGARFDGEFSSNVRSYAGTANLRWAF
ncbi:hypothetical protein ASE63_13360 [Bosea sp. Root381]|nr:hypothetical protein ASE63_13360 [Bosea sp. Root381]